MACQCGSQKKSTAPDTINPVNIGNLCFLFGVEGALCGFLDLIPTTINSILKGNNKPEDADKIFWKWIARFAKTGYNIVIDEATGDIDLSSFCSNPPPPLPEDITLDDVFRFFAEAVPIVSKWLFVADIVLGIETKLIDKVTAYWLFEQWYENCECKKCGEPPPPPPPDEDNIPPPAINLPDPCLPCPEGWTRAPGGGGGGDGGSYMPCKNLRIRMVNDPWGRMLGSCHGFGRKSTSYIYQIEYQFAHDTRNLYRADLKVIHTNYRPFEFWLDPNFWEIDFPEITTFRQLIITLDRVLAPDETTPYPGNTIARTEAEIQNEAATPYLSTNLFEISKNGGAWEPFANGGGTGGEEYPYPPCLPCIPPSPPKPPKDFCDLYPNHPDCVGDDDDDDECEDEYTTVAEFTECGLLRKPKSMTLIKDGDLYDAAVVERVDCNSVRGMKVVQYFECAAPPPPPPPPECEGIYCDYVAGNTYDLLSSAVSYGYSFYTADDAILYLTDNLSPDDLRCCMGEVNQGITNFFIDYPPPEE